jgi:hypothetical protein
LPVNWQTVKQIRSIVAVTPADALVPRLRRFVRESLDAGYPSEQLYVDLVRTYREPIPPTDEEVEDALLDVMDFLTGWCAPDARLY